MDAKAARALIEWYAAMGVDEAIGERPVDRFDAAVEATPRAAPRAATPPAGALPDQPMPRTPAAAPHPPLAAADLVALEAAVAAFEGCGLKRTAKKLVFASGNPAAAVMIVGDAPGREEDLAGAPFVGPAGQLLGRMLAAIGLGPDDAYLTNCVYWRPPGNRPPTAAEVAACAPFAARHIALARPRILVLLGAIATQAILGREDGMAAMRGKWHDALPGGHACRALPMMHPAYLLRNPVAKRLAWRDLLLVERALGELHEHQ